MKKNKMKKWIIFASMITFFSTLLWSKTNRVDIIKIEGGNPAPPVHGGAGGASDQAPPIPWWCDQSMIKACPTYC